MQDLCHADFAATEIMSHRLGSDHTLSRRFSSVEKFFDDHDIERGQEYPRAQNRDERRIIGEEKIRQRIREAIHNAKILLIRIFVMRPVVRGRQQQMDALQPLHDGRRALRAMREVVPELRAVRAGGTLHHDEHGRDRRALAKDPGGNPDDVLDAHDVVEEAAEALAHGRLHGEVVVLLKSDRHRSDARYLRAALAVQTAVQDCGVEVTVHPPGTKREERGSQAEGEYCDKSAGDGDVVGEAEALIHAAVPNLAHNLALLSQDLRLRQLLGFVLVAR